MNHACRLLSLACLVFVFACTPNDRAPEENFADENYMGEKMAESGGNPAEQVWCEVLEQQAPRKDCDLISKVAQVTDGSAALNVPDPMQRGDRTSVTLFVDRRSPKVIESLDAGADENASAAMNATENADEAVNPEDEPDLNATVNMTTGEDANAVEPTPPPPPPPPAGTQNPTPKQQASKLPGTSETYTLKVGRRMRANLTGQGFEIKRVGPAIQEIALDDQGSWTWEVTALQGGPKTLTVTTVVEALVNGHSYQLRQTKHVKTLTVGVSFLDRVKDTLKALPEWLQLLGAVLTALAGVAGAWWLVKRNWRSGPGEAKPAKGDKA